MRLIYHPDAETELIEAAQYYERRVAKLGVQFLDDADRAVSMILGTPERWRIIEEDTELPHASFSVRNLLPCFFRPHSHSRLHTPQPTP